MMGIATAIALTAYPGLEGASQTKKLRVTSNFPNFSAGVSRLRGGSIALIFMTKKKSGSGGGFNPFRGPRRVDKGDEYIVPRSTNSAKTTGALTPSVGEVNRGHREDKANGNSTGQHNTSVPLQFDITFFKDGFTVLDLGGKGAKPVLRPYEGNEGFLNDLRQGYIPKELSDLKQTIDVNIINRRSELSPSSPPPAPSRSPSLYPHVKWPKSRLRKALEAWDKVHVSSESNTEDRERDRTTKMNNRRQEEENELRRLLFEPNTIESILNQGRDDHKQKNPEPQAPVTKVPPSWFDPHLPSNVKLMLPNGSLFAFYLNPNSTVERVWELVDWMVPEGSKHLQIVRTVIEKPLPRNSTRTVKKLGVFRSMLRVDEIEEREGLLQSLDLNLRGLQVRDKSQEITQKSKNESVIQHDVTQRALSRMPTELEEKGVFAYIP
ncbi:hypothetical protein AAMO2058_000706300 [Amorphochlora amoebiformis]